MKTYDEAPESYFHHAPEVWDKARCEKAVKHTARDGCGTPYPFKGSFPEVKCGPVRYNGGCIRNDTWYEGEHFSLPVLAPGFKWVSRPTWCWQIVKDSD